MTHHRLRPEADHEARSLRLPPEVVIWATKLIALAAPQVYPGQSPCDYGPWTAVLDEAARQPPWVGKSWHAPGGAAARLMFIAEDIGKPGWPEPRRDLIEFALTFLEADVMLFRSGYTKRHLLRRLQQSPLTGEDIRRIDKILRRAVTEGAGLEEFRAACKLAAHLVVAGNLPDLHDWLTREAEGAILTLQRADAGIYELMLSNPDLSAEDLARVQTVRWTGWYKWGVAYPALDRAVPAGDRVRDPDNQRRYGAFLMLEAIRRRNQAPAAAQSR